MKPILIVISAYCCFYSIDSFKNFLNFDFLPQNLIFNFNTDVFKNQFQKFTDFISLINPFNIVKNSNLNKIESSSSVSSDALLAECDKINDFKEATFKIINETSNNEAISQLINFNFYSLIALGVTSILCVFFIYKYYSLLTKFRKLARRQLRFLNITISNAQSIKKFQKSTHQIIKLSNNTNTHLLNLINSLKNHNYGQNLRQKLKSAVDLSQRNCIKACLHHVKTLSDSQFTLIHQQTAKKLKEHTLKIYETLIKERIFANLKTKPSYLMYCSVSFFVMYALIEFGLSDFNSIFLENIDKEYFASSSYDCFLNIQDFNRIEKNLRFNTFSNDKAIETFHQISLKKYTKYEI